MKHGNNKWLPMVGVIMALSSTNALGITNVIFCGYNGYGQSSLPSGMSNVEAVAKGVFHSLALRADGTVVAWGNNGSGQTNVPSGLSNVVAVAAGYSHSAALLSDSTIIAWGDYLSGQTNLPTGLSNSVALSAGWYHTLALRTDGTVVAWGGNNDNGETAVPIGLRNVVAVAAGYYHNLALCADGTTVAWGYNLSGQSIVPSGLSNVVAIAAGFSHNLAVRADGRVVAWGDNTAGQTNVPSGLSNVVAVAAGVNHSMALQADGKIVSWGGNDYGQRNVPPDLRNFVAVTAGWNNSLAVVGVGKPFLAPMVRQIEAPLGVPVFLLARPMGELPIQCLWQKDGEPITGATNALLTLTATNMNQYGDYCCIASNAQGVTTSSPAHVLYAPLIINTPPQSGSAFLGQSWGFSVKASGSPSLFYQWQKGGLWINGATSSSYVVPEVKFSDADAYGVVVSNQYGCVTSSFAELTVRNVAAWGRNNYGNTIVPPGLSNAVAVAGGGSHNLALCRDGSVMAWGYNNYGQTSAPPNLSNVVSVAAGSSHSLALRADGKVTAWGYNANHQTNVPPGLSNVVAITAGLYHNLALKSDGTVTAWEYNGSAQTTVPLGLSNVVAVGAGIEHSLALCVDGTVAVWGKNDYQQTNVPPGLCNVVSMAAGPYHNLAVKSDGTVVAWGNNSDGQTTVPVGLSNVVSVAAGANYSMALRVDGTVAAWGKYHNGSSYVPMFVPSGLSNVVAVTGGDAHGLALIGVGIPFLAPIVSRIIAQQVPVFLRAWPTGELPMSFSWLKDSVPLGGATNVLLTLPATNHDQSGDYCCIVSNPQGVTTGAIVHVTIKDNDGDGMPDDWEIQYFGSMTNADSTSHHDEDNSSDYWEYLAGTDPTNRESVFAISGIQAWSTNAFIVQWYSRSNRHYTIGRVTNGLGYSFSQITTNLTATQPLNTYTDRVDGVDKAFYRISVGP